jgi:two-component system OmpR family sensor kinase
VRGSLAARVGLASALTVALAGVSVALVSTFLADRIHRDRQDERMVEAARTLAYEIVEEGAGPEWAVEDENRELAHTGIRVAIDRDGVRVAGEPALPSPRVDACAENAAMRACAVAAGPWTAVAAQDLAPWSEQRAAIGLASAIAVLVTTLLGALVGLWLARTLLAPLARLQRAVEHVDMTRPSDVSLGPDEGVDEVDALRGALRTVLERLAVSLSRSQRFSRDAAHELRTPLATMLGELELAAEALPAGSTDEVRRAHRVATRLSGLVERLLILARVDEPTELRDQVSLRALLEEIEDELAPEHRSRLRVEGADAHVRGEPSLLAALLNNVIDNALKFSDGPVVVELREEAGGACVIVSDEGPGLSEEDRARAFEPFHRSPAARASGVPGHGVGLSLVQHVAALHGGSARFVDAPRGARLEVHLRPPPPKPA